MCSLYAEGVYLLSVVFREVPKLSKRGELLNCVIYCTYRTNKYRLTQMIFIHFIKEICVVCH